MSTKCRSCSSSRCAMAGRAYLCAGQACRSGRRSTTRPTARMPSPGRLQTGDWSLPSPTSVATADAHRRCRRATADPSDRLHGRGSALLSPAQQAGVARAFRPRPRPPDPKFEFGRHRHATAEHYSIECTLTSRPPAESCDQPLRPFPWSQP